MGRLSDSVANNLLDAIMAGAALTLPATLHVALSTTAPTNTGGNVTEPVGGGYARAAVTRNGTNFPAASGRTIDNGVDITFPAPTGNWGTVTHFALYSAASGGTFLGWGAFAVGVAVTSGGTAPVIQAGALVLDAPGS